jgi:transglutaminase-like putative cysteine protease
MSVSSGQLERIPILGPIWRQIQNSPKPVPEDSILLRVMVQGLAIVGIIAIDVAAGVATDEVALSVWAVPLSIVGATWSWYGRYRRNVAVKFCIAIGMLLALASFLGQLVVELSDTRLVLAELLIQLQVLHSFDLPRRKDLGYTMVIGLILLGVAATLSQTLSFGPVLLVFVAIAIPALILDYRSRLELGNGQDVRSTVKKKKSNFSLLLTSTLSPKRFAFLLLVILGLGLAIFAFLPRLPGYQLRTFPVSAPLNFEAEQFDGRNITNPGYVGRGNEDGDGDGLGEGTNIESGAGTMDSTYYYGFNTKINQNLRGELTPQVVMRVRSQAEGFWRVLAFDRYTGQGWEISRNDNTQTINRPRWSYQFYLPAIGLNGPKREVIQTYTIVSMLPNLIPAMYKPEHIYFPTEQIALDPDGNLRSPLELREGLTYTVISEVPYRDRTLLSEAGTNYSKNVSNYYLQVPPEIEAKVRAKTEEILALNTQVAQNKKALDNPYEIALYLAQYLKQNPNYKLQQAPPFLEDDEDLVEAFLFGYRNTQDGETITGGYGDHFSTVLTIMLRSIGIPARLVAGYQPGDFNPFTGLYVVENTDAYAMTEVYFPEYGWFAFNPIPGMPLIPPSIEENQTFTALKAFWNWVAGWLPSPVTGFLERVVGAIFSWLGGVISWLFALFSRGWAGFFSGLILLTVFSFGCWVLYRLWQGWRYRRRLAKLPPMESLYRQMLDFLAVKGWKKRRSQTPFEYARAMREVYGSEEEAIARISQAYVSWRYGGKTVNLTELQELLHNLKRNKRKSS